MSKVKFTKFNLNQVNIQTSNLYKGANQVQKGKSQITKPPPANPQGVAVKKLSETGKPTVWLTLAQNRIKGIRHSMMRMYRLVIKASEHRQGSDPTSRLKIAAREIPMDAAFDAAAGQKLSA